MSMAAWSEGTHIPSHGAHVVLLRPATASDRRQGRPCRPSRMARASRSQDADHHIRCIGEDEIKRSVTQQDEADFQASKLKVGKASKLDKELFRYQPRGVVSICQSANSCLSVGQSELASAHACTRSVSAPSSSCRSDNRARTSVRWRSLIARTSSQCFEALSDRSSSVRTSAMGNPRSRQRRMNRRRVIADIS